MDTRDLKKFLSGLCIASLLAGASLTIAGCPQQQEQQQEEQQQEEQQPEQQQGQQPSSS